jgi:hypothetical protein
MYKIALCIGITGLFTICSGGPVAYDTSSTGSSASSYSRSHCYAFLNLAGEGLADDYCPVLTLRYETVANSENEAAVTSAFGDGLSFSPGSVTLSRTESMDVLAVFLLGDLTNVADINFVAPGEFPNGGAAARNIFAYLPSIPLTIAMLFGGTTLILVGRLNRRRGSRSRSR